MTFFICFGLYTYFVKIVSRKNDKFMFYSLFSCDSATYIYFSTVNLIGAVSVWVGTKNSSNHLIINGHTFTQAAVEPTLLVVV